MGFVWVNGCEETFDPLPSAVDGARPGDTHPVFDLGEGLFERIEVEYGSRR